jgi:hypothetical protein
MERRKTPRKDWVISKDDVGRSILEWKVDPMRAKRMESDPCARTYDFLKRLEAPDLTLEEEAGKPTLSSGRSFNPYNHVDKPKRRNKSS